ncbi:alpha-L-rhamnosidase [Actinomadura darangshiensis]|uniref:Alpha-L-rhamnosidase n=1 Tax=Actinomadura darangshiensis TaxID=705336 RepID=A0A4V6PF08_9ACTN|nr:glycosyl hydrolase [Actinomadura darangshiensis]TDD87807.1 alpha-L-rhamnosidase [Actinomadura darangshiensis]
MNDDRNGGVTRRRVLQIGGAAAAAVAAAPALGGETAQAAPKPGGFTRPGPAVRPRFRWWWPDGLVDPGEIRREIDQIAAAGFGGAEIAAVHHSIDDKSVLDPEGHGWGTPAWTAGVEAALDQAARRRITVDLTIGPAWPAAVPTITPDDEAAVQELAYGTVAVAGGGTHDGPVPGPVTAAGDGVTKRHLVAVHAVKIDTANATRKETGLDPASLTDLTGTAAGERITWTVPAGGDWLLFAYWRRGSGQRPESGPHSSPDSCVVDHFSRAGTRAVTAFWEARLLTRDIRRLIRRAGATLFEDSIELETDALNWTPGLPAEFERRRGYDLMPYLPVVVRNDEDTQFAYDAATTSHVRHDFWLTISDLLNEYHFAAVATWAHSIGLRYRAQPYGLETDAIQSAAILDVPEGESLGFKNLDDYRVLAGGRDMGGRKILSSEAGAYPGGAYNTTWGKVLRTMGGAYAAGLNQTVLHGFSYAHVPGAAWPGFAAFTPYNGGIGYSESWGPRQPTWRHVPDVAAYMSRVHQAMQAGESRIDVAVFRQKGYSKTGIGAAWFTKSGVPVGWTHQFVSAPVLDLPSATVSDGRLAPDGPAYKVLFVEGDRFSGKECTLPLDTARTMLKLTKAGLPLVFLGDWSAATLTGLAHDGENERLRALLKQLFAQPRVRNVLEEADVPGALDDLGLRPAVRYAEASTLLTAHRQDGRTDYYYLCNGKDAETPKPPVAAIDHEVTLTRSDRRAVPYRLDLWTGETERIAVHRADGDTITLRVALQPSEATVIMLARGGRAPSATASEAQLRVDRQRLIARATAAGRYTTTLPGGRTVTTTIGAVPAAQTLTSWRLRVEDMTPDGTKRHDLRLDGLKAWPDIPELADVSGIGTYTTTVHWTGGAGALLELGEVLDTCRVTVNGHRLPVSVVVPTVDIGPHLRRGRNTIEVEVATTLNNRLRVCDPDVYGNASRQNYGLIGPVRLVPYGEAPVRTH